MAPAGANRADCKMHAHDVMSKVGCFVRQVSWQCSALQGCPHTTLYTITAMNHHISTQGDSVMPTSYSKSLQHHVGGDVCQSVD
jgi:hypothetical protein